MEIRYSFGRLKESKKIFFKGQRKPGNIAAEPFGVNVAQNVAWMSKRERSKAFFASEMQILRLQDMLLGYANEETFGKHLKSVFLWCFPSDSSFAPPRNIG